MKLREDSLTALTSRQHTSAWRRGHMMWRQQYTCPRVSADWQIRFLRMSRRMNTFGKACSNKFCMVCEWNTLSSLSMISKRTDWKFHAQFNIMFPCLLACISYYQLRRNVSNIYKYMSELWESESQESFHETECKLGKSSWIKVIIFDTMEWILWNSGHYKRYSNLYLETQVILKDIQVFS